MKEITVQQLKEKKDNNEDFILIDVREEFEYEVSNLDGKLIPLGELQTRLSELEDSKDAQIIMMCRSGARSGRATQFMESEGFSNVANLKGGIMAWAREIDPDLPIA